MFSSHPIILRGGVLYYTYFTDEQTGIGKVTRGPTDRLGTHTQALHSIMPSAFLPCG